MKETTTNFFNSRAKVTDALRVALTVSALVTLTAIVGCGPTEKETSSNQSPPKDAVPLTAETKETKPTASGTIALSPENTTIAFLGEKLVGSHDGKFNVFSGNISFKNGDPATAEVNIKIDMSSVKTDDEKLDGHLKSPDFFDVAKFPNGTFISTEVTNGGEGNATHTVKGKLTLHGVTKPVAIPSKITVTDKNVAMTAEATINRQDFGISFPGMPDNLIKDNVKISLKIDSKL